MAANHSANRNLGLGWRCSRSSIRLAPENRVRMLARDATTPNFTSSVTRDASAIGIGGSSVHYNNRFRPPKEFPHADLFQIPAAKSGGSRFPDPLRAVPDLWIRRTLGRRGGR